MFFRTLPLTHLLFFSRHAAATPLTHLLPMTRAQHVSTRLSARIQILLRKPPNASRAMARVVPPWLTICFNPAALISRRAAIFGKL